LRKYTNDHTPCQRQNRFHSNLWNRKTFGAMSSCSKTSAGVSLLALSPASFHKRQGRPLLDDFAVLLEYLSLPGDHAAAAAIAGFFVQHLGVQAQGVADEDRVLEYPFANAQKCQGAHRRSIRAQAGADGPDQKAMSNGLTKDGGL